LFTAIQSVKINDSPVPSKQREDLETFAYCTGDSMPMISLLTDFPREKFFKGVAATFSIPENSGR
jgi:hypothetical protein